MVLSTNWADIGKTTTEVKPPGILPPVGSILTPFHPSDGMEWKKYD